MFKFKKVICEPVHVFSIKRKCSVLSGYYYRVVLSNSLNGKVYSLNIPEKKIRVTMNGICKLSVNRFFGCAWVRSLEIYCADFEVCFSNSKGLFNLMKGGF